MINYLLKYGISQQKEEFDEIDVTDKMALESQINVARRRYNNLMKLMDEIDGKLLDNQVKISKISKEIIHRAKEKGVRPNELYSTDDEYLECEYERDALKTGKEMIASQIAFVQNDLRIFNSVFYNKF